MAIANDLECLDHRNTGGHHGRQLSGKNCDIFVTDPSAGSEKVTLGLDPCWGDALSSEVGSQSRLIGGERLAAHLLAAFVLAFPNKLDFFFACGSRNRHTSILALSIYSIVTLLISSKLVTPTFTFSNPERRRFQMPSFAA